jgi:hypothetical protein
MNQGWFARIIFSTLKATVHAPWLCRPRKRFLGNASAWKLPRSLYNSPQRRVHGVFWKNVSQYSKARRNEQTPLKRRFPWD